jgi:hypothetical protein
MANLRKNANWPADRVERWPVSKLVPNARNARIHNDEQVAQLAASIEEWGWTIPVLVDETGGIIAGHGRIMAAHRLGIEDVPVMVAAGWSDAKKRAYMLADNKLTLNAEWDLERLAIEIAELRSSDFDISLIGFSESEIDDLLRADGGGLTDPDEAPDPPAEQVSELGDVWLLGKHRLVCGDCTDSLVVDKALGGVKPHLMVTDPPYGEYLIRDNDRAFGGTFKARVRAMGIRDRPTSFRSPWQNGYAERLIGSVRRECTDHLIAFNAEHLRRILAKYAIYYNEMRTHVSLGKDTPCTRPIERFGDVVAHPILGGLHHRYARI